LSSGPLREDNFPAGWYHFPMPISDTSPTAQATQFEIQRSMSGEQRLLLAFEMSMFARELNRERIRSEHPEWSEARVARELLRLALLPAPLPDVE
jgi:Rv0078B-related antitoxin